MPEVKIYVSVLEDAHARFKEALISELNKEDFDWADLSALILEEDSPLQKVFSSKVMHLSNLYESARKVHQSAFELNEMDDGDEK